MQRAAAHVQSELYGLMSSDPESALSHMVELAAEQGVTLAAEEVKVFLRQMDVEEEFDDIAMDAIALTASSGGSHYQGGC